MSPFISSYQLPMYWLYIFFGCTHIDMFYSVCSEIHSILLSRDLKRAWKCQHLLCITLSSILMSPSWCKCTFLFHRVSTIMHPVVFAVLYSLGLKSKRTIQILASSKFKSQCGLGGVSAQGNLHICDGTINTEIYIQVLEHRMLLTPVLGTSQIIAARQHQDRFCTSYSSVASY